MIRKNIFSVFRFVTALILRKKYTFAAAVRLTDDCNLNCSYCVSPDLGRTLDFDSLLVILEDLYRKGMRYLILSGGEPYLYRDINALMDWLEFRKFYVVVNTNGYAVDEPGYRSFLLRVDEIVVSLDGIEAENDFNRGRGCFEKVLKTLDFLETHRRKIILSTVLTKKNTKAETVSFFIKLKEKFNLAVDFGIVSAMGDIVNKKNAEISRPSQSQMEDFVKKVKIKKKYFTEVSDLVLSYLVKPRKINCKTANYVLYIDVDLELYPCIFVTGYNWAKLGQYNDYIKNSKKICIDCPGCSCNPVLTLNNLIEKPLNVSSAFKWLSIRLRSQIGNKSD